MCAAFLPFFLEVDRPVNPSETSPRQMVTESLRNHSIMFQNRNDSVSVCVFFFSSCFCLDSFSNTEDERHDGVSTCISVPSHRLMFHLTPFFSYGMSVGDREESETLGLKSTRSILGNQPLRCCHRGLCSQYRDNLGNGE